MDGKSPDHTGIRAGRGKLKQSRLRVEFGLFRSARHRAERFSSGVVAVRETCSFAPKICSLKPWPPTGPDTKTFEIDQSFEPGARSRRLTRWRAALSRIDGLLRCFCSPAIANGGSHDAAVPCLWCSHPKQDAKAEAMRGLHKSRGARLFALVLQRPSRRDARVSPHLPHQQSRAHPCSTRRLARRKA